MPPLYPAEGTAIHFAVEEERRSGLAIFVGTDKDDTLFAQIRDRATKKKYYLHGSCLLDGAVLKEGQRVSYALTESKAWAGERRAVRGRVKDEDARRRGVVRQWDGQKGHGYITEGGPDKTQHYFNRSEWKGEDLGPRRGMAVLFSGATSAGGEPRDLLVATNVVPTTEAPPAPEASSSAIFGSLLGIPLKVYILWDFDQTFGWSKARVVGVHEAILERLVTDGFVAHKAEPKSIAFGNCHSLRNQNLVHALNELKVSVMLQSGLKKEQVDGELARTAQSLATLPATTTLVIVSSDKGFSQLVQDLARQGKRTVVVHEAKPGSLHEKVLCVYAEKAYRLADLGVQEREGDEERRRGWITDLKEDKNGKLCGYIEDGESDERFFFHSANAAPGLDPKCGLAVFFSLDRGPNGDVAVDVAGDPDTPPRHDGGGRGVAAPEREEIPQGRRCGVIVNVKTDRNGRIYGHIEDRDSRKRYFFHSANVADGVDIACGEPVSFSLVPDNRDPAGVVAVDVDVDGDSDSGDDTPSAGDDVRQGVICKWFPARNFGLIMEEGEERDVYFRLSAWRGMRLPVEGMVVDFIAEDNRTRDDQRYGVVVQPAVPHQSQASSGSASRPHPRPRAQSHQPPRSRFR